MDQPIDEFAVKALICVLSLALGFVIAVIYIALRKEKPNNFAIFKTEKDFMDMLNEERKSWKAYYEDELETNKLAEEAREFQKGLN